MLLQGNRAQRAAALCTPAMGTWGRAVIYLPSSVENNMYQPGIVFLSYFPGLPWRLLLPPSLTLAFSPLQFGCAGCEATVRSPWQRPRCLNPLEVFRCPAVESSFLPMRIWIPNTCSAIAGTWPIWTQMCRSDFCLEILGCRGASQKWWCGNWRSNTTIQSSLGPSLQLSLVGLSLSFSM